MNNIFKVKIHFLFFLFAFISIITGMFREFTIFTFIIIIHELGHIIGALIFKIYPKQINILPFGGLTIFEMPINTSLNKELVIALSGPIFQVIGWYLFRGKINSLFFDNYNYFLLLFNLLPIYPLDGSKILNCFINKFISFKKSFFIIIYISIITIILSLLFIYYKHFSFGWIIIFLFLILKIIKEYTNFNFIFNKFLWERYNYKFFFKKEKMVKSIDGMQRDCKHTFKINHLLENEQEILKKRFDFQGKV